MGDAAEDNDFFLDDLLVQLRTEVDDPFWVSRIDAIEAAGLSDDIAASLCVVFRVLLMKIAALTETNDALEHHFAAPRLEKIKDRSLLPFGGRLPDQVITPAAFRGRYHARRLKQ